MTDILLRCQKEYQLSELILIHPYYVIFGIQGDRTRILIMQCHGLSADHEIISRKAGARPKAVIAMNKQGRIRSGQVLVPKGYDYWILIWPVPMGTSKCLE